MTTVTSDLRTKPCLRKAGAINFHAYLRSRGSVPPELRSWYDEVEQTWEAPIVVDDAANGFYSQFYRPKNGQDAPGYCPPVLAFRGSEVSDFDINKLAVVLKFEVDFDSDVSFSALEGLLDGAGTLGTWLTNGGTMIPFHGAGKDADHDDVLAYIADNLRNSRTLANLSGRTVLNLTRPNMISPLVLPPVREQLTINYRLSAVIHFDHQGDWGTNITQGMGEYAKQYELAAIQGALRAQEAMDDHGGKLLITGHSLGGGLAATAAISAKFHHPDCDVTCVTYNAAGVHENSVTEFVGKAATLGQNSDTSNFSVNDEILNTMQIQQAKLPFITPFILWANGLPGAPTMGFRQARNQTAVTAGISPGQNPMGYYAAAGDPLPKLWPVRDNTLREAQIRLQSDPATDELVDTRTNTRNAATDALFAEEDRLWRERDQLYRQSPGEIERIAEIDARMAELETLLDGLDNTVETQIPTFPDLSNVSNFPVVSALEAMARSCTNADQFVTGLVAFILTGEMNPHRAGGYDISSRAIAGASARVSQLTTEFKGIAPIGGAAVMYHTFDPCAATFHGPWG